MPLEDVLSKCNFRILVFSVEVRSLSLVILCHIMEARETLGLVTDSVTAVALPQRLSFLFLGNALMYTLLKILNLNHALLP